MANDAGRKVKRSLLINLKVNIRLLNIILAAVQCTLSLNLLAVTPSGNNKTVANSSLEIPSWLYSCIGWSSLLNHLTDGVSFTLHYYWHCQRLCYNSRFQIGLNTQRVWAVIKMMQLWPDYFKRCELMRSRVGRNICATWAETPGASPELTALVSLQSSSQHSLVLRILSFHGLIQKNEWGSG